MRVCISDEGYIQCLSDTCTEYCPKFNDCPEISRGMASMIRELAADGVQDAKHKKKEGW